MSAQYNYEYQISVVTTHLIKSVHRKKRFKVSAPQTCTPNASELADSQRPHMAGSEYSF